MSHDLLSLMLRFNLALAAAIVLVLIARTPVQRWFGARIAYAMWLIPPLAATMCFLPPRTETVTAPPLGAPDYVSSLGAFMAPPPDTSALAIDLTFVLVLVWIGGALLSIAVLALRQHRFVKALGQLTPRAEWGERVFSAASNDGGPAVLGAFRPVIITPADFEARYSTEEMGVVLAHERAHLAQGDPWINALAALIQCASWFNPLVHVAARALRTDQELSCDEAVVTRNDAARRAYAEALLKAHTGAQPVPLGCAWPPHSLEAFKERIAMLKRNAPTRTQILVGAAVLAFATVDICALAWSAQPPRIVTVAAHNFPPAPGVALSKAMDAADPDLRAYRYADTDLAGGGDDAGINDAEIEAQIREAMAEAQAAIEDSQRELETSAREMSEHSREMGLSDVERREIMEEARRGIAEAQADMRQVQAEARRAMRDAQRDAQAAEREAHDLEVTEPVRAELAQLTQRISATATELARLTLESPGIEESVHAGLEAKIEADADRIEELARQLAQQQRQRMDRGPRSVSGDK